MIKYKKSHHFASRTQIYPIFNIFRNNFILSDTLLVKPFRTTTAAYHESRPINKTFLSC